MKKNSVVKLVDTLSNGIRVNFSGRVAKVNYNGRSNIIKKGSVLVKTDMGNRVEMTQSFIKDIESGKKRKLKPLLYQFK